MRMRFWQLGLALLLGLCGSTIVAAQTAAELMPYLQAEVNEIAILNAQWRYLQQQGDPVAAAVLASYIPDHQLQADTLSAAIIARGGDPTQVQLVNEPVLASRQEIITTDLQQHAQVIENYRQLQQSATDPAIQSIAINGLNGASRHFSSLQVAQAATIGSPQEITEGLVAALTLERGAVANLQTQATRAQSLGDTTTANRLLSMIPQHQQQAARLQSLVVQMGGDPALAVPPPTVQLATVADIENQLRVVDTQFVNTYALSAASLPPSPIQQAMQQGQRIALAGLNLNQTCPAPRPA